MAKPYKVQRSEFQTKYKTAEDSMLSALKELNVSLKEFHDMGFTYRRTHLDPSTPGGFMPLVIRIV